MINDDDNNENDNDHYVKAKLMRMDRYID